MSSRLADRFDPPYRFGVGYRRPLRRPRPGWPLIQAEQQDSGHGHGHGHGHQEERQLAAQLALGASQRIQAAQAIALARIPPGDPGRLPRREPPQ